MSESLRTRDDRASFMPMMIAAKWASTLVLTVMVVLAARLVITAWQLETAPGVLFVMTQDATVGWLGWEHERINRASGSRQADFWLAEVDRVLAKTPTSEMARGAAWVLDSPGTGFYARYLKPTNFAKIPVEVDSERVSEEVNDFEGKAGQKCIEIAELATRLAPDEVQGWRTRAMLQFQSPLTAEPKPRDEDWRVTLKAAAVRDPNNALYDYLAADQLWTESTSHDFSNDDVQLIVRDAERFAECSAYFEQGQMKGFPREPELDWQAVVGFLTRSNVPLHEHPEFINNRLIQARETGLGNRLLRMELERAEREPPQEKLRRLRNCLRLADQIGATNDLTGIGSAGQISDIAAENISELLKNHRDDLPGSETADINRDLVAIHVRNLVWETAARDMPNSQPPSPPSFSITFWALLSSWLLTSTVLLAAISLLIRLGFRILLRNVVPRQHTLGIVRNGVCWGIAFGVSFVVLGLAPGEVVSNSVQDVFAKILISFAPVVVIGALLVWMLRRRHWQFSLLELLIATPILGALLLVCMIGLGKLTESGTRYYVHSRLDDGVDPAAIQAAAPIFRAGSIEWALIQWNAYSGMTVAILLALALVVGWEWYRNCRDHKSRSPWRVSLRGTFDSVNRSAACAAFLSLIVFLALAPGFLRECQTNYKSQMAWYFDLQDRREAMAAKIKAIESDPATMKEFREVAEQKVQPNRL